MCTCYNSRAMRAMRSRTMLHASALTPWAIGTLSADLYTLSIAFTISTCIHAAWQTKSHLRPGRTKTHVATRMSPLSTVLLQALHRARLVGASPIEYVLGCVLKPGVRVMASTALHMADLHQHSATTSLMHRLDVRHGEKRLPACLHACMVRWGPNPDSGRTWPIGA